jgi:hypothetical protein
MQTGIFGYKGRIHYHAAPCINAWLPELADMPKTEFFTEVARRIDQDIHRSYQMYPCNYIAADLLEGTSTHQDKYTEEDKAAFEKYLSERVAMVDLENKDEAFLRDSMLKMYANPLFNQLAAQ